MDNTEIIKNSIFAGKEIAIWGTGKSAEILMVNNIIISEITDYLIDNDENKKGTIFYGNTVKHPSDIDFLNPPFIIVTSIYYSIIKKQLNDLGLKENKDFIPAKGISKHLESMYLSKGDDEKRLLKNVMNHIYNSKDLEHLRNMIRDPEVKVVNFNLLNTLLVLPVKSFDDIYKIVCKRANFDSIFSTMRKKAEIIERMDHSNLSIEDIYHTFSRVYQIPIEEANRIMQIELEVVSEYFYPRQSIKKIFEEALALKKEIIITSNLPYPIDFIDKILKNNGYHGYSNLFKIEKNSIIDSFDIHIDKFKKVYNNTKYPNLNEILFICSEDDKKIALSNQWKSFYIPSAYSTFVRNFNFNRYNSYIYEASDNCFIMGFIANYMFDDPFIDYDFETYMNGDTKNFSTIFFAPLLLKYVLWMQQDLMKKNVEQLILIYRDGYLIEKIIEILKPYYNYSLVVKKAYLSRTIRYNAYANKKYGFLKAMDELPVGKLMTIDKYVDNRLLVKDKKEKEDLLNYIKKVTGKHGSDYIGDSGDILATLPILNSTFIKNANMNMDIIKGYCKSFIDSTCKTAIFDVGYRGSVVDFLHTNFNIDCKGYHIFATSFKDKNKYGNMNTEAFIEYGMETVRSSIILHPLIEDIISIQEGTAIGIEHKENGYEVIKDENNKINDSLSYIQDSILSFIEDFVELFGKDIYGFIFDHYPEFDLLKEFLIHPNKKDAEVIKGLDFIDSTFLTSNISDNIYNAWYQSKLNH